MLIRQAKLAVVDRNDLISQAFANHSQTFVIRRVRPYAIFKSAAMFPSFAWLSEVVSQPFKRSQSGLFQGKMKRYGNNVPFSKHKTRRTWLPNVQSKRISSEVLGQLKLKVTTRALRTIKKHGGLDKYLEKTSATILGNEGMRLRLQIREKKEEKTSALLSSRRRSSESPLEPSDALRMRIKAGEALGLGGPAGFEETIQYLQSQSGRIPI